MSFKSEFDELLSPVTIGTMNDGVNSETLDPEFGWSIVYKTVAYNEALGTSQFAETPSRVEVTHRFFLPIEDDSGDVMKLRPGERSETLYIVEGDSIESVSDKDLTAFQIKNADIVLDDHFEIDTEATEF